MDKALKDELVSGARSVGVELTDAQAETLLRFQAELLLWTRKINLTAITQPTEVVEKHLVDSLAAARMVPDGLTVLDLGAGGGFPSVPLAVVRPGSTFTLVDTVGKKVGFLKAVLATLDLKNAKAIHARAEGSPAKEGLPVVDLAICRAFVDPTEWVKVARPYVKAGGSLVSMVGPETAVPTDLPAGMRVAETAEYRLPRSGASRRLVRFQVE